MGLDTYDAVKSVKASEERRHEYMVMMIREMEAREEAREEGIDQTRIESIKSIMKTLKLTVEQAMDALQIPKDDRAKYMARL